MNFKKKLLFTIAVTAVFYLLCSIWAGWEQILTTFSQFHWELIPLCLAFAFSNYIIRFTKWHYYLGILKIPLDWKRSFQIFLAGLVMSATPGKFGEVYKSYLLKGMTNVPISKSAPVVLAERFTDFIAFLIIALLGVMSLPNGLTIFSISVGIILFTLIFVSWKTGVERVIQWLEGFPAIGAKAHSLRTAYESAYQLIAFKPLLWAVLISLVSWFMECIAFYLVLWGFGTPLPLVTASFIYAFATIVGALLMTPGGVGPTEGAMGFLLIQQYAIPQSAAASATFLVRLCTLWFAVGVGLITLTICAKTLTGIPEETALAENNDDLSSS